MRLVMRCSGGATAWRNVSRELLRGVFSKDGFLIGLFYMLITILFEIGTAWLAICNIIPIAGTVLWIVLLFQAVVFAALATLRMTTFNRLGAAFDMSEIIVKLRRKSTGLYKTYLAPWGICLGIIVGMFLIAFIVTMLIGLLLVTIGGDAANNPDSAFPAIFILAFTRAIWLYAILMVAIAVASAFLVTLAEIWSYRSLGYWFGYWAYDWICQADMEKVKRQCSPAK